MVTKVGLGILGVGICCLGGIAIGKPSLLGLVDHMPEWHSLSEDSNYTTNKEQSSTQGYKDGIGKKYSRYLVGVTNKQGTTNKNNKEWWEWSFRRWRKDKPSSGKFKYVENGDENTALNKVCEAAYKANYSSEVVQEVSTGGEDKYKESDIWKYCSPLGHKPVFVQAAKEKEEGTSDSSKIGKNKESELVSTTDRKNDIFWEVRNKEFINGASPFNIEDSNNEYFKAKKSKHEHIRNICKEAYNQSKDNTSSVEDKPINDEVTKFCGFKDESSTTAVA